jgi:hypothetical protein
VGHRSESHRRHHIPKGPARRHGLHNVPKTWVTLSAEWIFEWFKHSRLLIEIPRIRIYKTHESDVVVDFLEANDQSGEDLAAVIFFAETDGTATSDRDDSVVERILGVPDRFHTSPC